MCRGEARDFSSSAISSSITPGKTEAGGKRAIATLTRSVANQQNRKKLEATVEILKSRKTDFADSHSLRQPSPNRSLHSLATGGRTHAKTRPKHQDDRVATRLTQATVATAVLCSADSIPSAFTATSARHANCPGTPEPRPSRLLRRKGFYEAETRARRAHGAVVRTAVAGVGRHVLGPELTSDRRVATALDTYP